MTLTNLMKQHHSYTPHNGVCAHRQNEIQVILFKKWVRNCLYGFEWATLVYCTLIDQCDCMKCKKFFFEILESWIMRCVWKMCILHSQYVGAKARFYNKTNEWWWRRRRQRFGLNFNPNLTQFKDQMFLFCLLLLYYFLCYVQLHIICCCYHCVYRRFQNGHFEKWLYSFEINALRKIETIVHLLSY